MVRYNYTAISQPRKTIQGEIEAASEQDAINKLAKSGYFITSIQSEDASSQDRRFFLRFRRTSNKDLSLLTRQLASLVASGVNILNSLNIVYTQTPNKYLKSILSDVIVKIKDGKSLSESLTYYPQAFSNLYISIVHSGEIGGNLEEALKRLADFLEKEEEFINSIRAALTYPAFVFAVGTVTVIILVGFVVPKLITIFEDMGQILPLSTRILVNLSELLRSYWWFIGAVIFTVIFLLRRLYRGLQFRIRLDRFKLKLAIWGNVILKTEISRLARTLSLLLHSGIPVIYALDISTSVVENHTVRIELQKFKDQINSGLSFSRCLKDSKLFPVFVTNIIAVGEESGNLELAFMSIADAYEKEVDRLLKTLPRLLEPIIILIMGLIVGFIVLSMLLPIFQINLIVR